MWANILSFSLVIYIYILRIIYIMQYALIIWNLNVFPSSTYFTSTITMDLLLFYSSILFLFPLDFGARNGHWLQ